MPVCPNCEYEYVQGITICPDCGEKLVEDSQMQKPPELSEKDWEVVYTSDKEYEIEMLKDNLEAAGLGATILSQKDRNFPAPGDFSVIKLLVKRKDLQEALNYIQQIGSEKNTDDDN